MNNFKGLTKKEEKYINKIVKDLEFYDKYKEFIREVKSTFLSEGTEAARQLISNNTDIILSLAVDELYSDLLS